MNNDPPLAWVIGGTSGIGLAVSQHLQVNGWMTLPTGKEVDIRNSNNITSTIDGIMNQWPGQLKAVVYSAGVNRLQWIGQNTKIVDMRDELEMMSVNAMSFLTVVSRLRAMISRPLDVVAISSDAARRPMRTSAMYCASKAALDMLVKCAARELGPHGWRINAVSPGMVSGTKMTEYIDQQVPHIRGWTEEETRRYEESQEVVSGRILPGEVAVVVHDVLTGPRHLNGAIIEVNGGR